MKKYILSIFIFASCLQVFPQETYLIRHLPQHTNGYLVLENNFQVGIRYWSVDIILNFYDDFELHGQEVLDSYELIGKNYMKIPDEYSRMDNLSVKVTAHFQNDTYIEEETPISTHIFGGPNYETYKYFPCIGSTYAYEIVMFKHKTVDKSYLAVYPTAEQNDPVVWYYEYFPFSLLNTLNPQSYVNNLYTPFNFYKFWEYHNIENLNNLMIHFPDIVKKPNNNPQALYKDGNGTPISEPYVFGVKKHTGPWSYIQLTGTCLKTDEIQTINIPDLQTAIMYLNIYGSPVPCGMYDLVCDNMNPPTGSIAPALYQEFGKEIALNLDTLVWNWWDLFWPFQSIVNLEINEILEPYSGISVSQLSGAGNLIGSVKTEDMFDNEGSPVQIPIQLNPGLYDITFHFNDGSFLRIVEEKTVEEYNPNAQANYLNAVIFPVPIEGNSFNMSLTAQKELDFIYVLYDFNGNPIYETNIYINEGSSEEIKIEPYEGIPAGFLVNVFYFDDGSQMSILTVKTE